MNTYVYKVTDTQRDENGIIIAASFTITASDTDTAFSHNYHTAFPAPKSTPTPYADVTEEQVIGWIKAMFDTTDAEGNYQSALEDQADAELSAFKLRKAIATGVPWG